MFTLWSTSSECVLVHDDSQLALKFDQAGRPSQVSGGSRGEGRRVVAFLGTLLLHSSAYLIVARTRQYVGELHNNKVFKISQFELVPTRSNESQLDLEYKALVLAHLKTAPLFLSETWDLTKSLQHQVETDSRFWWNADTARPIVEFAAAADKTAGDLAVFIQKVIFGVFELRNTSINGKQIQFGLVTRRSRSRAGTRYFRRGIDEQGNVANFNETEQLLIVGDRTYSYLQTRGSVPVYWGEVNHMKYRPMLRIGQGAVEAARKHFDEQINRYGNQYLVNLVNQSGYEKPVKDAYEQVVKELNDKDIQYVYFDFHHECSKMRWHRVFLLLEKLEELGLKDQKWYQVDGSKVTQTQKSVVRTNCMDCLDRTNVVQSCLGGWTLDRQLRDAGVLAEGEMWESDPRFVRVFRAVWADNADTVSLAYSGTGALKTDFTRTGQRTRMGAFKDLRNSVSRFYLNNLRDGPRQDGFNLFLGDVRASAIEHNPFVDRRSLWTQSIPYVMMFGAIVFVLSVIYPSKAHSRAFNVAVSSACLALCGSTYNIIVSNGLQYVNWPKLLPTDYVEVVNKGQNTVVIDKQKQRSKQD